MKLFYIVCLLGVLFACSDETRENQPEKGEAFFRANPWQFYFVDDEGNSLIDMTPGAALPTTYISVDHVTGPQTVPEGYVADEPSFRYGNNSVGYDTGKGVYAWTTSIPGNLWLTESEFYVMFSRTDVDTIRVRFKFSPGEAIGGDGVAVDIQQMYYNNKLIIRNENYVGSEGIFIKK